TEAIEAAMASPSPARKDEPRLPPTVPRAQPDDPTPPEPGLAAVPSPRAPWTPSPDARPQPQPQPKPPLPVASLPGAAHPPLAPSRARRLQPREAPRGPPPAPAAAAPQPGVLKPHHAPWSEPDPRVGRPPPPVNGSSGELSALPLPVPERAEAV